MNTDVAPAVGPSGVLVRAEGDDKIAVLARGTAGTKPPIGRVPGGC